jgi:YegS/Rv2252/BmrU family lipid kinase
MRRARVIINPAAGAGRTAKVGSSVTQSLHGVDIAPDFVLTKSPGHASILAFEAARRGSDLVIAVGGDGTVHEVANGLLRHPSPPPLGLIQTGTGSDLSRVLALPRDIDSQVAIIARAEPRKFDVGRCSYRTSKGRAESAFLLLAGIGLSARVVKKSMRIKRLGRTLPYLVSTCSEIFKPQPCIGQFTIDNVTELLTILDLMVLNVPWVGGGMYLAPGADPQDGNLNTLTTLQQSRWELINLLFRLYSGSHLKRSGVRYGRTKRISVQSETRLPVALDGEFVGYSPVQCWVVPGALSILTEEVRIQ